MGRLLALVTDAFGGKGGIAQYNRDFLAALTNCGVFESIIVLPRNAPEEFIPPRGLTQLPPRRNRVRYVLAALWSLRAGDMRIIFCGHLYVAAFAAVLARLTRAKLIVQLHGIEAWSRPDRVRRYAVERANLVLCVSRYTRDAVLDWATIAPERIVVMPNTVAPIFTPGDGAALREELCLVGKKVLLTVGRMDSRERYKGQDKVIAALPQLIAEGHDVVYVIVGDGDDRARLEKLTTIAGLTSRVIFTGPFEQRRLVEAYRMADLFVMPSTGEGFGIAFIEAMACGTPALGLNVAGANEALLDGELGTAASEADFASALARQLAEKKPDREMLAAAVRRRFGQEVFAANLRATVLPLLLEAT